MASGLLRGGSIAQILSVLLFVFVSAHLSRLYMTEEATALRPLVEDGMSLESKVVPPHDSLVVVFSAFASGPFLTALGEDAQVTAPLGNVLSAKRTILRL